MKKTPTVLCILDGFGINPDLEGNAVKRARTPNFNTIWETFPRQVLITYGERVGLPAGSMGTSEVGHLNIGLGRVVEQWLTHISRLLLEDALPTILSYQNFVHHNQNRTLHLLGLISEGGVHSHSKHLFFLLDRIRKDFNGKIVIHGLTDGRDTGAQSGAGYIRKLEAKLALYPNVFLGSLVGRFFTMDRDTRWERVEKGYRALTDHLGSVASDGFSTALASSYENGVTDEFVEPIVSLEDHSISKDDALLFFNFREDRMREIVRVLTQPDFTDFSRPFVLDRKQVLCFTEYEKSFGLPFLFHPQSVKDHLGETISNNGKTQLRVAETEKYAHVTYFMNGKFEAPYPGEDRELVPSNREVKTYDLMPEMSAEGVCAATTRGISSGKYDFITVNFANCDMVGHTGNFEATVKAVEVVDTCLGKIIAAVKASNGNLLVIADHGNAEQMIHYEDGSPHTSHTKFMVPVVLVQFDGTRPAPLRDNGALCDVAPTLLELMKVAQPTLMTGSSLIR